MKGSRIRTAATGVVLAAAFAGGRPETTGAQYSPGYEVTYLEGLGGTNSRGNSINDQGWIAGYSNLDTDTHRHATLWIGGVPMDLGAVGTPTTPKNSNVVWPVKNTRGLIVGISQTDAPDPWGEAWSCSAFFVPSTGTGRQCLGFVWANGVMRPLPTLGGTHSFAAAANDEGQIAGWAETRIRDPWTCIPPQLFQFRAVIWGGSGNRMQELALVPGDNSSAATAINDKGQVVGISGVCANAIGSATAAHAVLWQAGSVETLPTFGGNEWNTPTAINEQGDVAGFSDHTGDIVTEAFFWNRSAGLQGLGFLYDHTLSEAFGLNDYRQVVGLSCGASECRAFLWENGVMLDLNTLIAPDADVVLTHAMDINNDGVITGRAFIKSTGRLVPYVARPVQTIAGADAPDRTRAHWPARVTLASATLVQILHPLGPGVARLR